MNVITITGNIGRDIEIRHTTGGKAVGSFSVADSQGKDKAPIWWNCDLWETSGGRLEKTAPYLTKGQQVTIVGQVNEREHEGKKYHSIRVSDFALQGGKRESGDAPAPRQQQRQQPARQNQSAPAGGGFADMDDDIPFADPLRNRALALCM